MQVRAAVLAVLLVLPSLALADAYDVALGQAAAATEIADTCEGIALIGPGDYDGFVEAAAQLVKAQGLRANRFKSLIYYAETASINQVQAAVLAERGVDVNNRKSLCAFGRKVAGQNDTIGRFLRPK